MGLFSWKKNKAKAGETRGGKKGAIEEQPKPVYKHVPKHAATDSYSQGGRGQTPQDRAQIALASRRREQNAMYDGTLGDATIAQDIAQNVAHGMSTPRGSPSLRSMHRNASVDGSFTTRDNRPGPSSLRKSHNSSTSQLNPNSSRNTSDYFSQTLRMFPTIDTSKSLGKRPVLGGYDSGYESADTSTAFHSRAPSEQNLADSSRGSDSSTDDNSIPELKLSEDAMTYERKSAEGVLKSSRNVSPVDSGLDDRGSEKSSSKQTRFEGDEHDPVLSPTMLEQHQKATQDSADSADSTPPLQETRDSLKAADSGETTEEEEVFQDAPTSASNSDPPTPEQSQSLARRTSSSSQSRGSGAPVRSSVLSRDSSIPPLSILSGYKVNKRGRVLDEEGDPIGELVKGDLLDCVRQRVNAQGEVVDEYGRVVGMVRTVPVVGSGASILSAASISQDQRVRSHGPLMEDIDSPRGRQTSLPYSPERAQSLQDVSATEPFLQELRPQSTRAAGGRASRSSVDLPRISPERGISPSSGAKELAVPRSSRHVSERSLSDLSKSYARPAMSSVPEHNVPEDDAVYDSSGLFSYKGDIPTCDMPGQSAYMRSKSPFTTPYRPALTLGHPGSAVFHPARPGGINSRRAMTQFTGSMPVPVHPNRSSSLQRSISGFGGSNRWSLTSTYLPEVAELPPNDSESSTDASNSDDYRMMATAIGGQSRAGSRAASIRTTASAATMRSPASRSYFTHSGRVTAGPDAPKPAKKETPAPPAEVKKEINKKKGRLGLSFGKKSKLVAAAA